MLTEKYEKGKEIIVFDNKFYVKGQGQLNKPLKI